MLDKNGIEIKTGDIVEVTGAQCEEYNGLFFVDDSSNKAEAAWLGSEHYLIRVTPEGKIIHSETGMYPIVDENWEDFDWSKDTSIEIKAGIDVSEIRKYFSEKVAYKEEISKFYLSRYGDTDVYELMLRDKELYESVVKRLK